MKTIKKKKKQRHGELEFVLDFLLVLIELKPATTQRTTSQRGQQAKGCTR